MKYVSHIHQGILDRKSIKNLVHKYPIILFIIKDGQKSKEASVSGEKYQFIYTLHPMPNFKPNTPLVLGSYNGVFGSMTPEMETENFQPLPILDSPLSNQLALYLVQELLLCPNEDKSYLENMIATMADLLVKRYYLQKEISCNLQMGLTPFIIQKIQHYVIKHIDRPILTSELAKVARLSIHHFIRVFKKTTGETPHQFIMRLKLEQAKKLLISTEESIIQIGMGVGCDNPSHFSQLFKTNFGVPPLKFRKAYQIGMLSA
ncbi:Helix-turn-helix domain-containing protein [Arenibacter palladensis]|uniref:Helix-turn-helix domain-containing protein n=1 Tax=Arenibacter palladensis TaxID=237373 RepID=A0A1M4XTE8_9FLAO|nr:AraC family transcriptional regulator [Arenibacter palladensis]SHE96616.1 Helix-turn-helix domain-containing protein [Arenibacter palladensis]